MEGDTASWCVLTHKAEDENLGVLGVDRKDQDHLPIARGQDGHDHKETLMQWRVEDVCHGILNLFQGQKICHNLGMSQGVIVSFTMKPGSSAARVPLHQGAFNTQNLMQNLHFACLCHSP